MAQYHSSSYNGRSSRHLSVASSASIYSQASLPRSEYCDSSIYPSSTTDRWASDRHRSYKKPRSSTPSVASTHASIDSAAAYYAAAAPFYPPASSRPAKTGHGLSRISEDEDRQSRSYYRDSLDSSVIVPLRSRSASGHRRHHSSPSDTRYNNKSYATHPARDYSGNPSFPAAQSMPISKPPARLPPTKPLQVKRDGEKARKEQPERTKITIDTDHKGYAVAAINNPRFKSQKSTVPEYHLGGKYAQAPNQRHTPNSAPPSPSSYHSMSTGSPRSEAYSADTNLTVPSLTNATTVSSQTHGPQTPRGVHYDMYDTNYEEPLRSQFDDSFDFGSPSSFKNKLPELFSRLFTRRPRSSSMVSRNTVDAGFTPFTYIWTSPEAASTKSLPALPSSASASSSKPILKNKHQPSASIAANIGETQSLRSAHTGVSSFRRRKILFNPFSVFKGRKRAHSTSATSGFRTGPVYAGPGVAEGASVSGEELRAFIQQNHPKIGKKGPRVSARRSTGVTGWITEEFQIDPREATMTLRSLRLAEGTHSVQVTY